MDTFRKIFGSGNLTGESAEGMQTVLIIVAILLLILAVSLFSAIENARFRSWYKCNSMLDTPMSSWRTIVPWHRVGSKWYTDRVGDSGARPGAGDSHADVNRLYDNVGKTLRININTHIRK